jgi:hypothetical protein
MGITLFVLTPFAAGFAAARFTRTSRQAAASALIATISSLLFLVTYGFEGLLCAIMAFPVIFSCVYVGAVSGAYLGKWSTKPDKTGRMYTGAIVLLIPAALSLSHHLERPRLDRVRVQTVVSEIRVPVSADVAWTAIASIDQVAAAKPLLMYVGLPIPTRCALSGRGVGATRICYFNNGSIEERVIEWLPPRRMGLRIDRTNMPGRHWLGFETASYELTSENSGTVVRRATTISSHLYPGWYWAPLERIGVEAEHRYIMDDLRRRVAK